jgi:hypothetical protein
LLNEKEALNRNSLQSNQTLVQVDQSEKQEFFEHVFKAVEKGVKKVGDGLKNAFKSKEETKPEPVKEQKESPKEPAPVQETKKEKKEPKKVVVVQ